MKQARRSCAHGLRARSLSSSSRSGRSPFLRRRLAPRRAPPLIPSAASRALEPSAYPATRSPRPNRLGTFPFRARLPVRSTMAMKHLQRGLAAPAIPDEPVGYERPYLRRGLRGARVPYIQRLYRFLVLRLGDERDARDALQETLLAAWQSLPRLREKDVPGRGWPGSPRTRPPTALRRRAPLDHARRASTKRTRGKTPPPCSRRSSGCRLRRGRCCCSATSCACPRSRSRTALGVQSRNGEVPGRASPPPADRGAAVSRELPTSSRSAGSSACSPALPTQYHRCTKSEVETLAACCDRLAARAEALVAAHSVSSRTLLVAAAVAAAAVARPGASRFSSQEPEPPTAPSAASVPPSSHFPEGSALSLLLSRRATGGYERVSRCWPCSSSPAVVVPARTCPLMPSRSSM